MGFHLNGMEKKEELMNIHFTDTYLIIKSHVSQQIQQFYSGTSIHILYSRDRVLFINASII